MTGVISTNFSHIIQQFLTLKTIPYSNTVKFPAILDSLFTRVGAGTVVSGGSTMGMWQQAGWWQAE